MNTRAATLIWLTLLVLTLVSFSLGEVAHPGALAVAVIGIVTFAKGKLVLDYFMGLREVGGLFRYLLTGWLVLVLSLVALAFRIA